MRGYQLALGIGQWTMDQTLNVVNLEPAAPGLEIRTIDLIHLEREMCVWLLNFADGGVLLGDVCHFPDMLLRYSWWENGSHHL